MPGLFLTRNTQIRKTRFVLLGLSIRLRVVVVCHCYRVGEDVIRIISARKANAAERNDYLRWLA